MKQLLFAAGACCALLLFPACMTLQEDKIASTAVQFENTELSSIERQLAALDAQFFSDGAVQADSCAKLLAQLNAALSDTGMQKATQARLFALYGRVQLLGGKKSAAKESYASSLAASRWDAHAIVLASRLGENMSLEASAELVSGASEKALLVLERALQSYASGNYGQAVASFDTAFISLEPFYRDAYKALRERAWSLRSLPEASVAGSTLHQLLQKDTVTVSELAYIAQSATQLLYPYTAGKTFTEAELYRRLSAAGVFSAASAAGDPPQASALLTRRLCARFLWNVYAAKKGLTATMYSALYRAKSLPSPVADISVDDADFDAVLGCVENELMALTDGVHFAPDGAVSAVDCNEWLLKLK